MRLVLKLLLLLLLLGIIVFIILGLTGDKKYSIARSINVDVPTGIVYPYISVFQKIDTWSPWSERDPDMKKTYAGSDGNVGATFEWAGNQHVGSGRQVITAVAPFQRVDTRITFFEPWKSEADMYYAISGQGPGTTVYWGMSGKMPFIQRAIFRITGQTMDEVLGADFELGLRNLKEEVEAEWERLRAGK